MGCCESNARHIHETRHSSDHPPVAVVKPPADTPDLTSEQLFRMGIAEAQMATVLPKRHRLKHIHTSRELLKIALQRCRSGDANLRAHLYAVLLKLGEDARSIQNVCEERWRQRPGLDDDTPCHDSLRGVGDLPHECVTEDVCSSSHASSETESAHKRFLDVGNIGRGENASDGDPRVEQTSPRRIISAVEPVFDDIGLLASDDGASDFAQDTWLTPSQLTIARLSDASAAEHDPGEEQFANHERGRSGIGETVCDDAQRTIHIGSLADGRKATLQSLSPAASAGSVSPSRGAGSVEHSGAEAFSWPLPVSLGAGVNSSGAPWSNATAWPTVVGTAVHCPPVTTCDSNQRGEANLCWSTDSACPNAVCGETADNLSARTRSVQPQQLGGTQLIANQRRARMGSSGSGFEQTQSGGDAKTSEVIRKPSHSPRNTPRHTGRQPSQRSSSGSQSTVSDSDSSSVAPKKGHGGFAPAIQEEPRGEERYSSPRSGDSVVALREGGSSQTEAQFRLSGRALAASDDDDKPEPSSLFENTLRRQGEFSGSASGEETILQNCTTSGGSRGHSRNSLGAPVLDSFACESSHLWPPPQTSLMPTAEIAASSSARAIESAAPSAETDLCNPLTRPELLAESVSALPQRVGSMPSPYAQSHASVDSISIAGSCLPSASPSPFVSNAVAKPDPTLTPSSGNATAANVVSVRIVNGVSGEEEVRFLMSVRSSFSEQNFHSMIDARCKEMAGQALSDLNWLCKSQGDRYRRRKCDLRMVEDLFAPRVQPKQGPTVLLLCTVPVPPPSELHANKVRLKALTPCRVTYGQVQPVRVQMDTSKLDEGHSYSLAFTHQWSNMTYLTEATMLPNQKGLEGAVPWQVLTRSSDDSMDGLYDVHLIMDRSSRSENRRTLTVVSAESELSSSTAMSVSDAYVPICKQRV
eukprot:TRINITY_DN4264_c0_g1_i1.p1 TRINITY_DN4264_c0_g1~~TRINITY_DN4264_c0_g1_i1.p1  ORF type:complete len:926 (-),score=92.40 TRINITY_DN4264_c0_g1_i1:188-2965(-)